MCSDCREPIVGPIRAEFGVLPSEFAPYTYTCQPCEDARWVDRTRADMARWIKKKEKEFNEQSLA